MLPHRFDHTFTEGLGYSIAIQLHRRFSTCRYVYTYIGDVPNINAHQFRTYKNPRDFESLTQSVGFATTIILHTYQQHILT